MAKGKTQAAQSDFNEEIGGGSFEAGLTTSRENIPEQMLVPVGEWLMKGRSAKSFPNAEKPEEGRISFYATPIEPQDSVDPDQAAGGEWKGELLSVDFFIRKASDFRGVLEFGEKLGLEAANVQEVIEAYTAAKPHFLGSVGTRTWTDRVSGQPKSANTVKNVTGVSED